MYAIEFHLQARALSVYLLLCHRKPQIQHAAHHASGLNKFPVTDYKLRQRDTSNHTISHDRENTCIRLPSKKCQPISKSTTISNSLQPLPFICHCSQAEPSRTKQHPPTWCSALLSLTNVGSYSPAAEAARLYFIAPPLARPPAPLSGGLALSPKNSPPPRAEGAAKRTEEDESRTSPTLHRTSSRNSSAEGYLRDRRGSGGEVEKYANSEGPEIKKINQSV